MNETLLTKDSLDRTSGEDKNYTCKRRLKLTKIRKRKTYFVWPVAITTSTLMRVTTGFSALSAKYRTCSPTDDVTDCCENRAVYFV
jgi:hypothetical protein